MVLERERYYYSKGLITNPVVYGAFSDSSDDSEPEEEQQLCSHARKQQSELERIARQSKYVLPPRAQLKLDSSHPGDTQVSDRIKLHRELVEQMKKSIKEQNRQRYQQEMEALRKCLTDLALHSNKLSTEDEQWKRDIEERRRLMEKAIEEEKQKAAKVEAEKKAKEEQLRQETEKKQQAEKAEKEKLERLKAQTPSAQEYKRFLETLDRYRSEYRPKLQNKELKSFIFKEKMPLKRYIKQLQFYPEVVKERHIVIRDTMLRVKSQNMDAYHILLNQMAKDFLLQVRTEVSAISWGAYFYGRLAMLLAPDLPYFLDYLLARLYKRCPYMIPEYHDGPNLGVEERKKLQHYEKNEDGFQSDDQYILYQTSYMYFFAALVQMKPGPGEPENVYGIKYGWMWLARICNEPPRAITANLLEAFLHVAAQDLLQAYPRQARKLLQLIYEQVLPKIPRTRDNTSPVAELQRKLEQFFKTGIYPKLPEQMEEQLT